MSIANLFSPNNYNLFAKTLELDSDVEKVTQYIDIYDGDHPTQIIATNAPIYYVVKNGIATVWMNTSAPFTFNFTSSCTQLYFAHSSTGYLTIPCPDVPDGKIATTIQAKSNNFAYFVPGILELDCSAGPTEGEGRIKFFFNPEFTVALVGGGPAYTWSIIPGSNVISQTFSYYGWSISYPVEGLN